MSPVATFPLVLPGARLARGMLPHTLQQWWVSARISLHAQRGKCFCMGSCRWKGLSTAQLCVGSGTSFCHIPWDLGYFIPLLLQPLARDVSHGCIVSPGDTMHIGCGTLRLQGCSFVSGGRHALEMPSLSSPAPEAKGMSAIITPIDSLWCHLPRALISESRYR